MLRAAQERQSVRGGVAWGPRRPQAYLNQGLFMVVRCGSGGRRVFLIYNAPQFSGQRPFKVPAVVVFSSLPTNVYLSTVRASHGETRSHSIPLLSIPDNITDHRHGTYTQIP